MKIRNGTGVFLIACVISLLLTSCDLMVLNPGGRTNPNDLKASILRLEPDRYGSGHIDLRWDWRDPDRKANDEKVYVDKIAVKKAKGNPPSSRLGAKEYSAGSGVWHRQYTNLDMNEEYYFGLWAHEKGGGWLAPVYASEYTEFVEMEPVGTYYFTESLEVDVPGEIFIGDVTTSTSVVGGGIWNVVYFDNMDYSKVFTDVVRLLIDSNIMSGTDVQLELYPLRYSWDTSMSPGLLTSSELLIYSGRVTIPATNATTTPIESEDIRELVSRFNFQGTGGIAITATGGTVEIDYTTGFPALETEYYRE